MNVNSSSSADNRFGPIVKGFRQDFDFTLIFEDAFLALVPSALLLTAAPIRTIWLWTSSKKVSPDAQRLNKVAFLAGFSVLEFVLLILWATNNAWDTPLSIPASAIDFAAACGLCVLSYFEHSRTVRPSLLINLYLALSLPFDTARTRTLWLIKDFRHMAIVQTVSLGLKLGILVLEAVEKRGILLQQYQDLPPEATSGIYSRSVFWWLNPVFRIGFKRNLSLADLDDVDDSLRSDTLYRKFVRTWTEANKSRYHALFFATFKSIQWPIAISALPRLLLIAFKFAQPFLLNRTTVFVSGTDPDSFGWGLVGAYLLVYVGIATLTALHTHLQNRYITMIRGGLVSMIYAKTVDLRLTSVDESSSLTLMSSDIERITTSLAFMNDTWAAFIEIGIALFVLERSLGVACIAPAIVAIVIASGTAWVTKYSISSQKTWVDAIQTRIAFTSRLLGSMRSIKLLGLSDIAESLTQKLREEEVLKAQKYRWFFTFSILMGNLPSILAPLSTFAVFVISATITGRRLNTAEAFTSLSIINLIEEPLAILSSSYVRIISSIACYDRIQSYLESPHRYDHRLRMSRPDRTSTNSQYSSLQSHQVDIELNRLVTASEPIFEDAIVVQDASFGWKVDGPPVLHDINLRIRNQEFTFIIGPVGYGKSTLLKGMLGETDSSKGFVYSSTLEVAFADQIPWIRNSTIRDNILGMSLFDSAFYDTVVDCCGLHDDIDAMPQGDETLVGSNGISLSGGQKQRLALARAIYSRKSILMLDDVFSGLDADTEEHIFTKVFGPSGVLRQSKTTVVMVTHAVHRLLYCDHVVVVKDGTVTEQGTLESLRRGGGYVQTLTTISKEVKDNQVSAPEKKDRQTKAKDQKLENAADDLARRSGDWTIYKYYIQAAGIFLMILFVIMCLVYSIAIKSPELLIKYWAEAVTRDGNKVNGLYMGLYVALEVISIFAITGACWIYILKVIPRTASGLHSSLLRIVMRAPLSFFTYTDTGSLTSRFSQDLSIIDFELPITAIQTIFMVFVVVITFALILISAGEFAATIPFLVLILWAVQKIYLRTSRQMRLLDLEAKTPLYSQFQESLSGLATIRAFGWASRFREENMAFLDESQKPFYLLFCVQRWLAVVLDLAVAVLAVVLMVLINVLRHRLDAGFVAVALLNIMSFNMVLASLIKSYTSLETSIGAVARIRSFVTETEQEVKPDEIIEPDLSWPVQGAMEINRFSASYSADSKVVLSDISLSIRAGERLGICGRSGSGKSSLLSSLLHLLEFADGSIAIDDVDISLVPRNILRQRLNVIPQEPYFIKGTYRINANPWVGDDGKASTEHQVDGAETLDESIIAALSKVGIWSTIESKGGLDADMESESLSLGQKQLFCLARALLRKSKVIILDEVTSSVDVKTDELMQRVIREEFAGCTIIAVAHRLNTIVDFDRIAVLGNGRLIECDTPGNLLGRKSAFKELYET